MGIDPIIWGPPQWFVMHLRTFNYPEKPSLTDKIEIKKYFMSVGSTLPCESCRTKYFQKLQKHPIDTNLHNRRDLVCWLIDIHNMINKELQKPILHYEKVIQLYKVYLNPRDN